MHTKDSLNPINKTHEREVQTFYGIELPPYRSSFGPMFQSRKDEVNYAKMVDLMIQKSDDEERTSLKLFNEFSAKAKHLAQFESLSHNNTTRIKFLFDNAIECSKRYERFEKKIVENIKNTYLLPFHGSFSDNDDELASRIGDYITCFLLLKGDIDVTIYNPVLNNAMKKKRKRSSVN